MTYKPDKLAFYSKSKDVSSGNGAQEYVNYTHNYKELNEIKDWRKILSNFHVYSFKYDDYLLVIFFVFFMFLILRLKIIFFIKVKY